MFHLSFDFFQTRDSNFETPCQLLAINSYARLLLGPSSLALLQLSCSQPSWTHRNRTTIEYEMPSNADYHRTSIEYRLLSVVGDTVHRHWPTAGITSSFSLKSGPLKFSFLLAKTYPFIFNAIHRLGVSPTNWINAVHTNRTIGHLLQTTSRHHFDRTSFALHLAAQRPCFFICHPYGTKNWHQNLAPHLKPSHRTSPNIFYNYSPNFLDRFLEIIAIW